MINKEFETDKDWNRLSEIGRILTEVIAEVETAGNVSRLDELIQIKKENSDLEQSDVVGDKSSIKDSEYYKSKRNEINDIAFNTKRKRY